MFKSGEAVQGRADRLATAAAAEALAHIQHQPREGPARRRVGPFYGRGDRCLLRRADDLAESGLEVWAKGGRPPLRR